MAGRRCRFGGRGRQVEGETAFQFQGTRRPGIRDVASSQGRFVRGPERVDRQKRMTAPEGSGSVRATGCTGSKLDIR